MRLRTPNFWRNLPERPGLAARLLSPFGRVYAAATARRVARTPDYSPNYPIICVGNLTAGGSGKTPTCIALIQWLQSQRYRPAILSRGYGSDLSAPIWVDPAKHRADQVGDEPLLMAAFAPVCVAPSRVAAARHISAPQADIVVMDDGFQDPSLRKDISLLVVDAQTGFGNGCAIPAGPLRESPKAGVARADLVLIIGEDGPAQKLLRQWPLLGELPLLRGKIAPLATGINWQGKSVLAFAGIAYPEKFFDTLRQLGADLRGTRALPDHGPISPALFSRLQEEAARLGAQLVTTEKDAVRLPSQAHGQVLTLPVRLEIDDFTPLKTILHQKRLG